MNLPIEIWIYDIFPRCELRVLYQVCKDWNCYIKSYHLPQLYSEFEKPGESFVKFLLKKGRILMNAYFYIQVGKFGGLSAYLTSRLILCPNELRYATVWFMRGAILQNDITSINKMMKSVGNLSPFFVFDAIFCGNQFLIDYFKDQNIKLNDEYVTRIKKTETLKVINALSCTKFGASFCLGFCKCSKVNFGSQCARLGMTTLTKTETNALLFYFANKQMWDDFVKITPKFKGINCQEVLTLIDARSCTKEIIVQLGNIYYFHEIFRKTCRFAYQGREDLMRLMIEIYLSADPKGPTILQRYLMSFHHYNLKTLTKVLSSYVKLPEWSFEKSEYPLIDDFFCQELLESELDITYVTKSIVLKFDSVHYYQRLKHKPHDINKLLKNKADNIIFHLIDTNVVSIENVITCLKNGYNYPYHIMNLKSEEWKTKSRLLIDLMNSINSK
jgi:hypothetical protein